MAELYTVAHSEGRLLIRGMKLARETVVADVVDTKRVTPSRVARNESRCIVVFVVCDGESCVIDRADLNRSECQCFEVTHRAWVPCWKKDFRDAETRSV
jgi:hypothetical protein